LFDGKPGALIYRGNLGENPMEHAGRVAFVTGGSRGIGREIAFQLARGGAAVAVADVREADVTAVAGELSSLGGKADGFVCDVSSLAEVERTAAAVIAGFGKVDFIVNNAGITRDKLLLRMGAEDWEKVLAVNLTGAFNVIKAFAPHMLKQRAGKIVNVSSVIGLIGNAGQANYAASKAGVIGLTRSLAKEFAGRGITVNAVAPGFIETAMTESLGAEVRDQMKGAIPLGRFGTVTDVANVVLFLLSGMSDYVTGQVINCDGGMVMA
jgi:3-oxoacyl-[acyl-carrier protein] reductase